MLSSQLFKTIIMVHFSSDTGSPLNSALQRMALGLGVSVLLALTLAKAISRAILPYGLPDSVIFSLSMSVGFIIGGFVMMAMHTMNGDHRKNTYNTILSMLSISKTSRWIANEIPMFFVLCIVAIFGGILLHAAASVMLVSGFVAISGWIIGLYSGYGCLLIDVAGRKLPSVLIFVTIVGLVGLLFDKLLLSGSNGNRYNLLLVINLLVIAPLFGHLQLYLRGARNSLARNKFISRPLIPDRVPYVGWYLVKMFRNQRTRGSLLIALSLSLTAAASIIIRGKTFADPYQVLLFGGVLAATVACDVRGVMAKYCPPEIILLKGTSGLVRAELLAVGILGVCIGLPIGITVIGSSGEWLLFAAYLVAVQWFSSAAGLMASTLFVPGNNDTAGQFMSAVIAICAIFALPRLGQFSSTTTISQLVYWLGSSMLFVMVINLIENYRRRNYGRS